MEDALPARRSREREEWDYRRHLISAEDASAAFGGTDGIAPASDPLRISRLLAIFPPMPNPLLERGLDTSSGLAFVRERLALLGKTLFLVSFGFYLFLLASMALARRRAVRRRGDAGRWRSGTSAASLTMALLWLLASRARLTSADPGGARRHQLRPGLRLPLHHDRRGRGADPPGAAGPHRHRHDPGDPGARPGRAAPWCSRPWSSSRRWSSASRAIIPWRSCPASARATRSCT